MECQLTWRNEGGLEGPLQCILYSLGDRDCNSSKTVTVKKALTGRRAAPVLEKGGNVDRKRSAPSLAHASQCFPSLLEMTSGQQCSSMYSWRVTPAM